LALRITILNAREAGRQDLLTEDEARSLRQACQLMTAELEEISYSCRRIEEHKDSNEDKQ
jgi:hypothetical protein